MAGILAVLDRKAARSRDAYLLAAAQTTTHRFGASPRIARRGSFAWVIPGPDAPLAFEFSSYGAETDQGLVAVVHGRLDNRPALLRSIANPSEPCSDAELVASGYRQNGRAFLASLVGNFAGVIRDPTSSTLIAIQDQMWMRPLYYADTGGSVVLASEIKLIHVWDARFREFDEEHLARFLANVDSPLASTTYRGVSLMEPGQMITFADAGGRSVHAITKLDRLVAASSPLRTMAFEHAVERLRSILTEVTSDVVGRYDRIGIFLSGGTDSMGATALAASHLRDMGVEPGDRLHAYCFDFTGFPDADERHISRQLTDLYEIPVTEIRVRDALPLSDLTLADLDDPNIGVYEELFEHTCRIAAADGMTAMLSGDRGDLVFGEMVYDLFGPLLRGNWYDFYAEMAHLAAHYDANVARYIARQAKSSFARLMERALPVPMSIFQRYRRARHRPPNAPIWIQEELQDRTNLLRWILLDSKLNRWKTLAERRLSMVRSPMQMRGVLVSERTKARFELAHLDLFSDTRLIEFSLSIPQHLITTPRYPKKLLRAALAPFMPDGSEDITQKIYPTAVYDATVRGAGSTISHLLSDMILHNMGYLDEHALQEVREMMVRREADPPAFWRALALERWLREHPDIRHNVDRDEPNVV